MGFMSQYLVSLNVNPKNQTLSQFMRALYVLSMQQRSVNGNSSMGTTYFLKYDLIRDSEVIIESLNLHLKWLFLVS